MSTRETPDTTGHWEIVNNEDCPDFPHPYGQEGWRPTTGIQRGSETILRHEHWVPENPDTDWWGMGVIQRRLVAEWMLGECPMAQPECRKRGLCWHCYENAIIDFDLEDEQ